MLVQQVLHAIHAKSSSSGTGKKHVFGASRRFLQPLPQYVSGLLGQGRATLLAPLSDDSQVMPVAVNKVVALQSRHLGQSKAGLHGGENERVIAPSRPGSDIRCGKQSVNLFA